MKTIWIVDDHEFQRTTLELLIRMSPQIGEVDIKLLTPMEFNSRLKENNAQLPNYLILDHHLGKNEDGEEITSHNFALNIKSLLNDKSEFSLIIRSGSSEPDLIKNEVRKSFNFLRNDQFTYYEKYTPDNESLINELSNLNNQDASAFGGVH